MIAVAGSVAEVCWQRIDVDEFFVGDYWGDPDAMSPGDWKGVQCEPGEPDDLCAEAILKVAAILDPNTGERWRDLCLTARELIMDARLESIHLPAGEVPEHIAGDRIYSR